jgi:hypothetical protein
MELGSTYTDTPTHISGVLTGVAAYLGGDRQGRLEWTLNGEIKSAWFAADRLVLSPVSVPGVYA